MKRTRVSGNRSRAGCITCRRRRVKCDETRPCCRRCQTGNRSCEGYGIVVNVPIRTIPESLNSEEEDMARGIRPKPSTNLASIAFGSQSEALAFELFRSQTVREMAGIRSSGFWKNVVLPACYVEPAVLHAALALASASWQDSGLLGLSGPLDNGAARIRTVVEYNQAISHLKTHVTRPSSSSSFNVTLIVCIIFIALELRTGRYVEALMHFNEGVKLLQRSPTGRPKAEAGTLVLLSDPQTPQEELVRVFADLDLQVSYFTSEKPGFKLVPRRTTGDVPTKGSVQLVPYPRPPVYMDLPSHFSSLDGAIQHLTILSSECRGFISKKHSLYGHSLEDKLAASQRVVLCDYIKRWRELYDQMHMALSDTEKSAAGWHKQSAFALIQHSWLRITLPTSHVEVRETDYDPYLDAFTTIVDCASRVLSESTPRSSFSLEGGMVPALLWTATKCRYHHVRHEALRLLGMSGREGMWDSRLVMYLAQGCIDLEEEEEEGNADNVNRNSTFDGVPPDSNNYWGQLVPEHRRVTDAKVYLDGDDYEVIVLMFFRKKWAEDGGLIGTEEIVRRQPFKTM